MEKLHRGSVLHGEKPWLELKPSGVQQNTPRTDDQYDLYDVAHVVGWELYNLHDLGHVSWVGSALYRSCTTPHNGRLGSTVDDIDRDLSDLPVRRNL